MNGTEERKWQRLQLEPAIACNLNCVMCPWKETREKEAGTGIMSQDIWEAVRPLLSEIKSIDFTGGGEPLLQPRLSEWIKEAKSNGCETGILTNGLLITEKKGEALMASGIDWISISIDGANAKTYNKIRKGSNFDTVCKNTSRLTAMRKGIRPKIMINYVLMPLNFNQAGDFTRLADRLGVDQINFKQYDVIRNENGKNLGLFAAKENMRTAALKKDLIKARRQARKLRIHTTAFDFTPEEQPVCDQNPSRSIFIRCDGTAAPCINLAYGGPTSFLGSDAIMPSVHYGRIPDQSLPDLWETDTCRFYRERFGQRSKKYENILLRGLTESFGTEREKTLKTAIKAMPEAPQGCDVCHYLYNI